MESKKINQLATELTPALDDLTIIGDPTTGVSKKITLSQMASLFTGTVEEYANLASFPLVGTADTIYIATDTNVIYRWNTSTSAYVVLSPNIIASLVFNDANGFDGNIALVGSTATLTITTALTQGSVPFIGTSGALTQDNANLFFDDTNNRLGINTNSPTTALDVFGSGIIGRLNGTSTNNAFLGFASAGSNKWSIGNVQSDHRFRIYNEATTSELVSVLQTGEFGIGIANPTTKVHIDGGASALIANLDADVSIAKSLSFRSDNSNRINLEVSGTESGSNAGANFFIRRYSDAGSLIDTPLTITRSTGAILATTTDFGILGTTPILRLTDNAATGNNGNVYLRAEKTGVGYNNLNYVGFEHIFKGGGSETTFLTINSAGAATFLSNLTAGGQITMAYGGNPRLTLQDTDGGAGNVGILFKESTNDKWTLASVGGAFQFFNEATASNALYITASNNVGIGTTTTNEKLDIEGNINLRNSSTYSTALTRTITYRSSTNSFGIQPIAGITFATVGDAASELRFVTRADAANYDTRLVITKVGHLQLDNGQLNSPKIFYFQANSSAGGTLGDINWYNVQWDGLPRAQIKGETDTGLSNGKLTFWTGGGGTSLRMTINSSGSIGAPSGTNIYNASDIRLKQNISTIETGLDKILALNPVKFNWIDGFEPTEDGKDMLGFIAQEVKQIIPEAVEDFSKNSLTIGETIIDNPLRVNEKFIIPVLVKAIQELEARIKQLESK
jgi:Chaperone of endosialidase